VENGNAGQTIVPNESDTPQNLSWREAIIKVLQEANGSMHYSDIADAIVARRLRSEVGATPVKTVAAVISLSSRDFVRTGRGEYTLRTNETERSPGTTFVDEPTPEQIEHEVEEESTGIIQAFGMYWARDLIVWSASPSLLGQQQTGAKAVNFANQRGVYLLYDDRDVIYVGRATDQGIGRRLFQHTVDRLSSRWNRFSWFGLWRVTQNGDLEEMSPRPLPADIVVTTMEALLIEGLEPPQNRRRGDDFRAVEYLQALDPELEKRRMMALLAEMSAKLNLR
jgi:HB1, ASXL, restriction endonuclease HTH domain